MMTDAPSRTYTEIHEMRQDSAAEERQFLEENIATVAFHLGQPGATMRADWSKGSLAVDAGEVLKEISRRLSAPAQGSQVPSREQLIRTICGHALCDLQHAQAAADAILSLPSSSEPAQPPNETYRETVRRVGAAREKRLAELRDALEQIAAVCADNDGDDCGHRLALRFVANVVARSLAFTSASRCTCAAIVNPNIPHARTCPLSSTDRAGGGA